MHSPHDIIIAGYHSLSVIQNFFSGKFCKFWNVNFIFLPNPSCSFNLGSGAVSVLTNKTFNDGDWHKVIIQRNKASGTIVVDKGEGHMASAPGAMKSLDINNGIFLGEFYKSFEHYKIMSCLTFMCAYEAATLI